MKSFKKIIASLLALTMIMALAIPFSASALANADVNVLTVDATPRNEVTVPISVAGAAIGAFQFDIKFDTTKLEYVDCETSDEFAALLGDSAAIFLVNANDAKNGNLILGGAITEGFTFTKSPLNLIFKAADLTDSADTTVEITVERLRTANDEAITPNASNGVVHINVVHITSIVFDDTSLTLDEGETFTPGFTVNPKGYTDDFKPTWESEDTEVATVDENGLITAVKTGTTNIKLKYAGITISLPIEVKVSYTPGDYDGDQQITVTDALAALRFAAKLATPNEMDLKICDVDGDKEITVTDALSILRVAAKLADPSSLIVK